MDYYILTNEAIVQQTGRKLKELRLAKNIMWWLVGTNMPNL